MKYIFLNFMLWGMGGPHVSYQLHGQIWWKPNPIFTPFSYMILQSGHSVQSPLPHAIHRTPQADNESFSPAESRHPSKKPGAWGDCSSTALNEGNQSLSHTER